MNGLKNAVYAYTRTLLSLEKKGTAKCDSLDELQGHHAKWNKLVTESQVMHDSTYVRYLKYSNSYNQAVKWLLPEAGEREEWEVTDK